MLPVSLDCPFLIAPSVFSNVYLHHTLGDHRLYLPLLGSNNKQNTQKHIFITIQQSNIYIYMYVSKYKQLKINTDFISV